MEFDKSSVKINRCIGEEQTQILIEGDIIVPDSKPDMEMVIKAEANACIQSFDILNDRLNFKGKINTAILYLCENSEKTVHSMDGEGAINDFINMEGVGENSAITMDCMLADFDYKRVNERKLSYRAVVNIKAAAYSQEEISVIRNIEDIPQQQQIKRNIFASDIAYCGRDKISFKEQIEIHGSKPNIQDILSVSLAVINKDCKSGDNQVSLEGDVRVIIIYKGEDESNPIEVYESELPLNGTLEAAGTRENMNCSVKTCIQDVFYNILPDNDGENRIVEIEANIGIDILTMGENEYEILEDAYCINNSTDIDGVNVQFEKEICRNKSQCPVKEVVSLSDNAPDMLQIMTTNGRAWVDNIEITDGKVIVEGVIEAAILYVTGDDKLPVHCHNGNVPFKHIAEARGAAEGMNASVDVSAEHIGVNMISDREVEVRCMLNINVVVNDTINDNFIVDIKFSPMSEDYLNGLASIVVYTVQKGDTLWKLAKRFNTAVDEIVALNNIENPDLIFPGEKFIIMKRV